MNDPLERVAELVARESGIQVKGSQLGALSAALGRVSPGMDADRFLNALADPAQQPLLFGQLIDQVAIQETFFMREPSELEAVDWRQLLAGANARGAAEVNVWVSACASGEEAYSVAMLATEAFGHGRPPVSILATDISMRALRRAEQAVYSERSTRELSSARRGRFLVRDGARSTVGEPLRSLVRLRRHNLVADPTPPPGEVPFDLVLCRNVLIYFGPETVETVVRSLESALQPGGQLILGASDRLTSSAQRLTEVAADEAKPTVAVRSRIQRRRAGSGSRTLRRPLGRAAGIRSPAAPSTLPDPEMSTALEASNRGEYAVAIESADRILAVDPLDAETYYVRGLSELAIGDPAAAVGSLRRALYVDPTFAAAAFQLGRAHDLRGDGQAARRAYASTLHALSRGDERPRALVGQVDLGDIAVACRARLAEAGDPR
ncbi:MAG TPA: CheR family methyltransferase [Solirubrobacterales bacterium]|nr:CheR family methyltransferase [Solirubrobacterales bacterium]